MKLCTVSLAWILVQCLVVGVNAVDCAPSTKSFTIKTTQDVSDINNCQTFTGNIVVAADGPQEVSLDGVATVNGNIDVENVAKLQSLSSTSLAIVSSFTLNNLPQLTNLSFPSLKNFSSLKWYNLPSLEDCSITTGNLDGEIQEITITNTSLKSLDWLKWPIGSQLNVTGNTNLQSFNIPYNTINSGSTLTFSDNPILANLNVSQLAGIYGALAVSGNAKTTQVSFSKLETIGGFVQMTGSFTNISMPSLNAINGALSVASTGDITALCNQLSQKKLAGHYDCKPNVEGSPLSNPTATASGTLSTPSSTSSDTTSPDSPLKPHDPLSTGVKAGLAIAALITTALIIICAMFYFRRRSRSKVREIPHQSPKSPSHDSVELSESPATSVNFPKELESPVVRLELAAGKERLELPGVVPQELDGRDGSGDSQTPNTPNSPVRSWGSVSSGTPLVRHELPA